MRIIQRQIIDDQDGSTLASTIKKASGISAGATDGFGITDNFLIRGLNARIYNDGFSQGDPSIGVKNIADKRYFIAADGAGGLG